MSEPHQVYASSEWKHHNADPFDDIQNVWEKTKFDTMRISLSRMRDLMDFCKCTDTFVTWSSMDGANFKSPDRKGITFNVPKIEAVRNGPNHIEFFLDGILVAILRSV